MRIEDLIKGIREEAKHAGCEARAQFPNERKLYYAIIFNKMDNLLDEMKLGIVAQKMIGGDDNVDVTIATFMLGLQCTVTGIMHALMITNEARALENTAKLIFNTLSFCETMDWPIVQALMEVTKQNCLNDKVDFIANIQTILEHHKRKN